MKMEGPVAVSRLLVGVFEKRLKSLGHEIDHRLLSQALQRASNGSRFEEKMGNLILTAGGKDPGDLVAKVGEEWKISLAYYGIEEGGEVSVFSREERTDGRGKGWYSQNLPDGSAAKILVNAQSRPESNRPEMAYVCRSSHMFGGLLWDWSADQPAEVSYYPTGNVYWFHRYQNGVAKGRSGLPVFENYWENGQVRIVEFGNDQVGKSRNVQDGPAYTEYYPDGRCAVEIYAERSWSESRGHSVLLPGWKARYFDANGKRTTREVMMETKSVGGVLSADRQRGLEDRGENKRVEQIFIARFTESIRLRDSVEPAPFFIAPSLTLNHVGASTTRPPAPAGLGRGEPQAPPSHTSPSRHI
jgi:hypothetical protein